MEWGEEDKKQSIKKRMSIFHGNTSTQHNYWPWTDAD